MWGKGLHKRGFPSILIRGKEYQVLTRDIGMETHEIINWKGIVISYQSLYTQTKLVLGSLGRGSQLLVYSLCNPHLESPYLAGQVAKWPGLKADAIYENEDMSSNAQFSRIYVSKQDLPTT